MHSKFYIQGNKMKKKVNVISLVACGLLLSSSVALGTNTVDSAFKEGKKFLVV